MAPLNPGGLHHEILFIRHCVMLYHDRVIVVGGGGSCFSFGARFNPAHVELQWTRQKVSNKK